MWGMCCSRIKEGEVLAAQRRHRAQHTAAGEAAAAQVAACLDSLQAEAQVRLGTCQRYTHRPVPAYLLCASCRNFQTAQRFWHCSQQHIQSAKLCWWRLLWCMS
jgi:hypothetical protein